MGVFEDPHPPSMSAAIMAATDVILGKFVIVSLLERNSEDQFQY
jgi:hypothetical protein